MREAEMKENRRPFSRSVGLILLGWILGLGWYAGIIAVRATRVSDLDLWVWCLLTPVWAFSFCVAAIGTHRLLSVVKHGAIRLIATVAAMAIQCFLFYFPVLLIAFYVHIWAGGGL